MVIQMYQQTLDEATVLEYISAIFTCCHFKKEFKFPKTPPKSSGYRGFLTLESCVLEEGLELPEEIGGGLRLSCCTIPKNFKMPKEVGGGITFYKCVFPDDFVISGHSGCLGVAVHKSQLADGREFKGTFGASLVFQEAFDKMTKGVEK